nr:unnamed protein product [Callosobruchus analis]
MFNEKTIKQSRMKKVIVKECLGITQLRTKKVYEANQFLDDVSRATAGKQETVTFRKKKMQKTFLLDITTLFTSFKNENPGLKCSYSYFTNK